MAESTTEIANLVLTALGSGKEIANLDTENSAEARAIRRVYLPTLKQAQREFAHPFSTKISTLTLVESDPNTEWAYSYRYPPDALMFRRILSGTRQDTRASRVKYRLGRDDSGRLIFSNEPTPTAEWTVFVEDVTQFPPDFVVALVLRLASASAARITAGDPNKLGERTYARFVLEEGRARANALNEEQRDDDLEADAILARDA